MAVVCLLVGMGNQSRSANTVPMSVEVRTPARLHLGMLSFGVPTVRSFGGVGVMLDRPGVHVRMQRSEQLTARGPMSERAIGFAQQCVRAWGLDQRAACAIEVVSTPRAHVGIGSGTQLALAVAAGMRHLYRTPASPEDHGEEEDPAQHEWPFDTRDALELARAVGRGKRSCVGVYGFSRGGLIVEAGRYVLSNQPTPSGIQPQSPEHLESGSIAGGDVVACEDVVARGDVVAGGDVVEYGPMVARVRLPSAWRCVIIIQRDSLGLHGEPEKAAFGKLPPVPLEISAELSRLALMDLVPAAVEGKFTEFSDAVYRYGLLAGKPFEQESATLAHAGSTLQLIELLGELGVRGCAQSSWGPAVMACCESLDAAGTLVEKLESLNLTQQYEAIIARYDSQGAVLRVTS